MAWLIQALYPKVHLSQRSSAVYFTNKKKWKHWLLIKSMLWIFAKNWDIGCRIRKFVNLIETIHTAHRIIRQWTKILYFEKIESSKMAKLFEWLQRFDAKYLLGPFKSPKNPESAGKWTAFSISSRDHRKVSSRSLLQIAYYLITSR